MTTIYIYTVKKDSVEISTENVPLNDDSLEILSKKYHYFKNNKLVLKYHPDKAESHILYAVLKTPKSEKDDIFEYLINITEEYTNDTNIDDEIIEFEYGLMF